VLYDPKIVPPEWRAWLAKTRQEPPSEEELARWGCYPLAADTGSRQEMTCFSQGAYHAAMSYYTCCLRALNHVMPCSPWSGTQQRRLEWVTRRGQNLPFELKTACKKKCV
jgi:hypothetical protein